MEYENYLYTNKNSVELLLKNADNKQIISVIIGAINGIDDWKWLQKLCLQYINHKDYWVSKTAISGIGDIARIHHKLDKEEVLGCLKTVENEKLKDSISSTMEDISLFIN